MSELHESLKGAVDREQKIPRALDALGPVADRDVVLLDSDEGLRATQLRELGGRVVPVAGADVSGVTVGSADVAISCFGASRGGDQATESLIETVRPKLRPGGRLLLVRDYGHDDVISLLATPDQEAEIVAVSRRDGWFLRHDFKIRVLHCWWSWTDLEEARQQLGAAFGEPGAAVAEAIRRPRLAWKVAVYHRTLVPSEEPSEAPSE